MPRINILYLITKLELGGAQKQLLSLIANLDRDRFNIFLFTAKDGLLIEEALRIKGPVLKRSKFLCGPVNFLKDILVFFEIYGFIKKNRILIVHTHSSKAGIVGRFAAKAANAAVIIHTVHGWSFHDYQPRMVKNFYIFLEKICAKFSNKIIVVSKHDKEKGLKNLVGSEGQYIIIRYGINIKEFKPDIGRISARRALGLNETDLVAGTVACFKPQKSPLDFINIAAGIKKDLPNIKFIMVGDGLLHKDALLLLKKLNLEREFILTGWRHDVASILSALDVFVLTSLWEGLPIAVLEAMAARIPVVATDTGGIREVIENGRTGYLVAPADKPALQNRIKELLSNKARRDEFIKLAEKRVNAEEFLISKMAKDTQELYLNLSGGA
ncbi:MAG: glycosyltransferase family 4 protein [Candidatus Omnitrophica bacterium]|jgi:glycosyltransferase involved in cell wall biosynthesis|nr:glycosyltransferase family 4 protein [Candidatus Omnitrophota bacterium]